MKRKIIFISSIIIFFLLVGLIFYNYLEIDFNLKTPVKRNVVFDYKSLNITNIDVQNNFVKITGNLNEEYQEYLNMYTIDNVDIKKEKDVLYIRVYGGYGSEKELKEFNINQQFEGEEIKKIVLKGYGGIISFKGSNSKTIWEKVRVE